MSYSLSTLTFNLGDNFANSLNSFLVPPVDPIIHASLEYNLEIESVTSPPVN